MSMSSLFIFIVTSPVKKLKFLLNSLAQDNVDSLINSFTLIYHRSVLGFQESVSGLGSTIAMAKPVRELILRLFQKF